MEENLAPPQSVQKKDGEEIIKNVHDRCTASLLRAKELIKRAEEQHSLLAILEEEEKKASSTVTDGNTAKGSSRGSSPPIEAGKDPRSSFSYIQRVWKRVSRSPQPTQETDGSFKDDQTPRKSVSFADDGELEVMTPKRKKERV